MNFRGYVLERTLPLPLAVRGGRAGNRPLPFVQLLAREILPKIILELGEPSLVQTVSCEMHKLGHFEIGGVNELAQIELFGELRL